VWSRLQASTSRSVSRQNLNKMGKIRQKLKRAVGFPANSRPILGVPVGISTVWKVIRCTPTEKAFPRRISRQKKIQLSRPGRLASMCALHVLSDVGASLQPHQLGVGVRGGAQIVGHAARACSENAETVTLQVDIMNAFNSVSRNAVLEQVFEHVPSLGPYAAFLYGTPSPLYVDGAPEGSARC
jgi:hypothetical protein